MSQDRVLKTLMDLGFPQSDAQIYVFLSKKGSQRGLEISKALKMNKQQLYPSLKNLQSKGIVSGTLEHPARFVAVPLERVFNSFVKSKMEEVQRIQQSKNDILADWQSIVVGATDEMSPRFMVLEGRTSIFSKIKQMIQETEKQSLIVTSVPGLAQANQLGLFDSAYKRSSKNSGSYRFLTEINLQNATTTKTLLKETVKNNPSFQGRTPNLGLKMLPRMVIKDQDELLFFIKPMADSSIIEQTDSCLWTNCKTLVGAFTAVFEDYWGNATEIGRKIEEFETGIVSPETCVIKNPGEAKEKYESILGSAKQEIVLLTSTEGLTKLSKNLPWLREQAGRGVSVSVLAPITGENLKEALAMLKYCKVRHISTSNTSTTTVDSKHLFQFKNDTSSGFENTFYTNDGEYVKKTRTMLDRIWNDALVPSAITIDYLARMSAIPNPPQTSDANVPKPLRRVSAYDVGEANPVTEKSILDKIINAKKFVVGNPYKDVICTYGHCGQAIIHPPGFLNLPDIMIHAFHNNKQSSYGDEDTMVVYLWMNTPRGFLYVPTAVVGDVEEGRAGFEASFAGTPAGQNVIVVRKDEIRVQMQGNTLFAGWTIPIPLLDSKYILPPAAIFLEAYGNLKPKAYTVALPSGFKITIEQNDLEAFVTFYHSATKYSGPGTEGTISREIIMTNSPPQKNC